MLALTPSGASDVWERGSRITERYLEECWPINVFGDVVCDVPLISSLALAIAVRARERHRLLF